MHKVLHGSKSATNNEQFLIFFNDKIFSPTLLRLLAKSPTYPGFLSLPNKRAPANYSRLIDRQ